MLTRRAWDARKFLICSPEFSTKLRQSEGGLLTRRIEFRSHFNPLIRVEFEQSFRRKTDWCDAANGVAIEHKVVAPIVFSRMKKQNDLASIWIQRC
jgi:hypothetical protein